MKAQKNLLPRMYRSVWFEVLILALFSFNFYLQTVESRWSRLIFLAAYFTLVAATVTRCIMLRSWGYIRRSVISNFQKQLMKSCLIGGSVTAAFFAVACFGAGQNFYFFVFGFLATFILYRHQLLVMMDALSKEEKIRNAENERRENSHLSSIKEGNVKGENKQYSKKGEEPVFSPTLFHGLNAQEKQDCKRWMMRFTLRCNRYNCGEIELHQLLTLQNDCQ